VFYLLSVLAIAAVLAAGAYAVEAVKGAVTAHQRLGLTQAAEDQVQRFRQDGEAGLRARLDGAAQLPLAAVERRIDAVQRALPAAGANEQGELAALLQAGPNRYAEQLAARYQDRIAHELLRQELAYLQSVRAHLLALQSQDVAQAERKKLLDRHRAVYAALMQKRQAAAGLGWVDAQRLRHPWARNAALDRLDADLRALAEQNSRAAAAYRAQDAAIRSMAPIAGVGAFAVDTGRLDGLLQPLARQLDEARAAVADKLVARIAAPLVQALPLACAILALAIAGRWAVRACFYFVLAPLATRAAPLRLARAGAPWTPGQGKQEAASASVALLSPSSVSQALHLAADEELLVLPGYLQSAPVGASRSTRWLIAGRPWASLSAGMSMLTCVRTPRPEEEVVLSASDDGLSELALLRIPPGQALAIQPRALVGVVARQGGQIDIRWHWRFTSLHAWLTLQLRFFVLRGPLTLAVQGRRGVRLEAARGTRTIRQTATLGFSTDVAYSTVRGEPFLPYLRGQAPLLYDRFGGDGVYLYDETPGGGSRPGRVSRGLEGVTDALLKLVGY